MIASGGKTIDFYHNKRKIHGIIKKIASTV
jgi:hypothetical protein